MIIKINSKYILSEKGKRINNEDNIYSSENLFIVCDGVGGANKGEVASDLVIKSITNFVNNSKEQIFDNDYFEKLIKTTERKLTEYVDNIDSNSTGMSTTLAMLLFNNVNTCIAWCGDSRVYHIRNGKILFRTKDHSLIQELIDKRHISEDEARIDKRKNIINRAISGMDNPTKVDIKIIDDIQTNDYFMLCSDGILECFSDDDFEKLFSSNNIHNIFETIKNECSLNSNDNYSLLLFQINEIDNSL